MKEIIMVLIISCTKGNFGYNNKYKNDINYYFNNIDKLNENTVPYIIEKAEKGNNKALFLYMFIKQKS